MHLLQSILIQDYRFKLDPSENKGIGLRKI